MHKNPHINNILYTLVQHNGLVIVGYSQLILPEEALLIDFPTSSTWQFFSNMLTPGHNSIEVSTIFARLQGR